jgi:hypothetical protein
VPQSWEEELQSVPQIDPDARELSRKERERERKQRMRMPFVNYKSYGRINIASGLTNFCTNYELTCINETSLVGESNYQSRNNKRIDTVHFAQELRVGMNE